MFAPLDGLRFGCIVRFVHGCGTSLGAVLLSWAGFSWRFFPGLVQYCGPFCWRCFIGRGVSLTRAFSGCILLYPKCFRALLFNPVICRGVSFCAFPPHGSKCSKPLLCKVRESVMSTWLCRVLGTLRCILACVCFKTRVDNWGPFSSRRDRLKALLRVWTVNKF